MDYTNYNREMRRRDTERAEGEDLTQMFRSVCQRVPPDRSKKNTPAGGRIDPARRDEQIRFMHTAGKVRMLLERTQEKIRHVLKEKSRNSLFDEDGEIQASELIYRVKEDLQVIPDQITAAVAEGAKARADMELVKNIKSILHSELIQTGIDFRKLLDKRTQTIRQKEDKKNRLDTGPVDRCKMLIN